MNSVAAIIDHLTEKKGYSIKEALDEAKTILGIGKLKLLTEQLEEEVKE